MGEKTQRALERIGLLLEGEESEGALMRIADTLEEVAETLDTALDIENEHGLTYQVVAHPEGHRDPHRAKP